MRLLRAILIVLVLAAAGAAGVIYTGTLDVSATAPESAALHWLLEETRERSIERRAEGVVVPDLSGNERIASGASAFNDMCPGCHGAPGRAPFIAAKDMNPPPPELDDAADEMSPAELFWVVKHGIRMTGMPAWGPTHPDRELWDLVAFLKALPSLDADAYRQLAASAVHHDHGEGQSVAPASDEHGHGDHSH